MSSLPFIISPNDSFVTDFFFSILQPPFYHQSMTIEESIEEWRVFGAIYEKIKKLSSPESFDFCQMEKELDRYYLDNPKFIDLYEQRKKELNTRNQHNQTEKTVKTPQLLKEFHMPDYESFEIAKAIGSYFSFLSINATYTGYNRFSQEEQRKNIKECLINFYFEMSQSVEHVLKKTNIGMNKLGIRLTDSQHSEIESHRKKEGNFIYSLNVIEINNVQNKNSYMTTFLHEYTHFIDFMYYDIFENNECITNGSSHIFTNMHYFDVNEKLNFGFVFSSGNGFYRNNKLYQVFNPAFHEKHADFINDYEESIYLNLTGKKLNRLKMHEKILQLDFDCLFKPVSKLINDGIIINTTAANFITQNKLYLSDFISSLVYKTEEINELLENKNDSFMQFISLDKYMKHKLSIENINTEISKDKFMHKLFIEMIMNDREIAQQLDDTNSDDYTPLVDRVYHIYPTVNLHIPDIEILDIPFNLIYNIRKINKFLDYLHLPGELLAFFMTNKYDSKPEYIKEANSQFYQKYMQYISDHTFYEANTFDNNIIQKLNILKDKKAIEEKVDDIKSTKVINSSYR